MNDEEIRSPDEIEFQEVDMGRPPAKSHQQLLMKDDNDDEFSSVALSEARNNHH